MASPSKDSAFLSLALLVNRVVFGVVVVMQSITYIRGGKDGALGHEVFYRDVYKAFEPGFIPVKVNMYYAYGMPYAGLLFGIFVLLGVFTRLSAGVVTLMLLTVLYAVFREHGMPRQPVTIDLFLVLLAAVGLLISAAGPGRFSVEKFTGGGKKAAPKGDGKDKE